eukprot:CAMPEP_0118927102 /NCGR_PEP_ID=MMETSP1169-20130426/4653_1 /TAXON_ID=36882 /ORGANISM="Pyramimonas obovata, Strain CCMP722" /LENGTH=189 /DNA_ID=CAMNT_0006868797 /DNA_START=304 /DNA_END=874 /DNA_ORIENTATION=+
MPGLSRKFLVTEEELPPPSENPKKTFALLDSSGDGKLQIQEVVDYIAAITGAQTSEVEVELAASWSKWDTNNDRHVDFSEFRRGLLPSIVRMHQHLNGAPRRRSQGPNIFSDSEGWFRHWDRDGSDSLDVGEVLRALSKTFRSCTREELKSVLSALWPMIDPDGSGGITREEFLAPDGLRDLLRLNGMR